MYKTAQSDFKDKYDSIEGLLALHPDLSEDILDVQGKVNATMFRLLTCLHMWPFEETLLNPTFNLFTAHDVARVCNSVGIFGNNEVVGQKGIIEVAVGGAKIPPNDPFTDSAAANDGFIATVVGEGANAFFRLGTAAGQHVQLATTAAGGFSIKGATATKSDTDAANAVSGINIWSAIFYRAQGNLRYYFGNDGETQTATNHNTSVGDLTPTNTEINIGAATYYGAAVHKLNAASSILLARQNISRIIGREWIKGNKIAFSAGEGLDFSNYTSAPSNAP